MLYHNIYIMHLPQPKKHYGIVLSSMELYKDTHDAQHNKLQSDVAVRWLPAFSLHSTTRIVGLVGTHGSMDSHSSKSQCCQNKQRIYVYLYYTMNW